MRRAVASCCWSGPVMAPTTRETDSRTSMLGKWPEVASRRLSQMWPSRIDRARALWPAIDAFLRQPLAATSTPDEAWAALHTLLETP